jgi:hypothetical protein
MKQNMGFTVDSFMLTTWYRILLEKTDKSETKEKWEQINFDKFQKILTGVVLTDTDDKDFVYSAIWNPMVELWQTSDNTPPVLLRGWYGSFAFPQPSLTINE